MTDFERQVVVIGEKCSELLEEIRVNKARGTYLTGQETAELKEARKKIDEAMERLGGFNLVSSSSFDGQRLLWEENEKIVRKSIDDQLADLDPASPEAKELRDGKRIILASIQRYKTAKI